MKLLCLFRSSTFPSYGIRWLFRLSFLLSLLSPAVRLLTSPTAGAPPSSLLLLVLLPLLLGADAEEKFVRSAWVKLTPRSSLQYLRYDTVPAGRHRVHAIIVDLGDKRVEVRPVVTAERTSPGELARQYGAAVAVNGGFFNVSDGASVSHVTIDGQPAADPRHNASLMGNPGLKPFLSQVLNRSELRILHDGRGNRYFTIGAHNASVPRGYRLLHSLQGGPLLQPALQLYEEAFIRPATTYGPAQVAAGALSSAARTAVGLLSAQKAVLVLVERGIDPAGPLGMSLPQLAVFMQELGCAGALALDGGSSSSLYVYPYLYSGQPGLSPAAVKSALLVWYRP